MSYAKKNVLIFASTFPRWINDPVTARFVLDLSQELKRYFNTFVLTPHVPDTKKYEEWEGVKIIRFPYFFPLGLQALVNGTGMLSCLRKNKLSFLQVPSFLFFQMCALRKVVNDFKIDVVNSHWMIPQGYVAALLKKSMGFRHVLTIHAAGLFALRRLPFGKNIGRAIVRSSDAIYSVSSYNHKMLNDLVKKDVKTRILPMGIHTEFFKSNGDRHKARQKLGLASGKYILFVGKLSEKKGVNYLLEAFSLTRSKALDAKLIIVGGGILEESLKRQAENLGVFDSVFFVGFLKKETIQVYYQACDLVVIPSIIDARGETEGLPVVLLEALASGKPVVATGVGGIPDLIREGENGFLAPQKDATTLAKKIFQGLNLNSSTLGRNAFSSVEPFDWKRIGENYRDTILELT